VELEPSRWVRSIARDDPQRVILQAEGRRITYAELDAQADGLAEQIWQRLGAAGRVVAMQLTDTHAVLVACLAVVRAGMVSVPIDPTAPVAWVADVLADADAALLLSDVFRDTTLGEVPVAHPIELAALTRLDGQERLDIDSGPIASIVYTSGSTGRPKGVVVGRSVSTQAMHEAQGYEHFPDAIRIGYIAVGTVGNVEGLLDGPLRMGATIVDFDIRRLGIAPMRNWLRRERIFGFMTVPTVLREFLDRLAPTDFFDDLEMVGLYGETALWEDLDRLWPHVGDSAVAIVLFGLSESGFFGTYTVTPDTPSESGPLPIGTPMPGRTVDIVDESGNPVAVGTIGEIVVRGEGLPESYLRRPDLTASTFGTSPAGVNSVRTGDLGSWRHDGLLAHHGRRDLQVQVAGHRVELGHIEVALMQIDGISSAAAVAYVDGAGDTRVAAYAVTDRSEREIEPLRLRRELAARLPTAMVPDSIEIVDEIPKLARGKVNRRAIRERAVAGVVPRSIESVEAELCAIWAEVLGTANVGLADNFFDLGGDSIRAARMFAEIERRFGVVRSIAVLLDAPTVAQLAEALRDSAPHSGMVSLSAAGPTDRPPLVVVHGVGGNTMYGMGLARHFEHLQTIWGLNADWTADGLERVSSLQELAGGYLPAIQEAIGQSPVILYGVSAGGALAFELASQLDKAGGQVLLVALGDTFGPGLLLEPRETGKQVVRRALRRRDVRLLATVIRRHLAYRFHRARLWLHGDLRESRALDRALSVGSAISPEHRWEYFSRQMGTLAALYEPAEPYGGQVTLLRSTHDGPEDLRWRRWVTGDLQIVPVNVPHVGMEEEPGLRAAARVIEQVVQRAGA
jgi:acyl-coenzyme A synthetase/AMP-(fatty) acid ligase/thioesterase domain-containing protein/acyl carrier protein